MLFNLALLISIISFTNSVHHWTFDNHSRDIIKGYEAEVEDYDFANVSFGYDRRNKSNSSVHFEFEYYRIPSDAYYNSTITITAWFKLTEECSKTDAYKIDMRQPFAILFLRCYNPITRLGECEAVGMGVQCDKNFKRRICIHKKYVLVNYGVTWNFYYCDDVSNKTIEVNKWYHIAYRLSKNENIFLNGTVDIFLNGEFFASKAHWINTEINKVKIENFIGRDSFGYPARGYIDDLKIFDGPLKNSDIYFEFLNF